MERSGEVFKNLHELKVEQSEFAMVDVSRQSLEGFLDSFGGTVKCKH